jgi:SAM-dependent methyltransferase
MDGSATAVETSLRYRLQRWFCSVPGLSLLRAEERCCADLLPNLFGYHLLQLGQFAGVDFRASSRVSHRIALDIDNGPAPEPSSESAVLRCSPAALPIASDSVDVVIMPHVLEFEADPHQVLREVERVLIGDGHVLIFGFNPFSWWGLWRMLLAWRGEPPWCGRYFTSGRMKDWIRLLGFDVVHARYLYHRPPLRNTRVQRTLSVLDKLGAYCWPWFGAVYCLVGKKRVVSMIPLRSRWQLRRQLIASGVAEPSTRAAADGITSE